MASCQEILSYRRTLFVIIALIFVVSILRVQSDTALFVERLYNRPFLSTNPLDGPTRMLPVSYDGKSWNAKSSSSSRSKEPTLDIVVSLYRENLDKTWLMLEEIKELQALESLTVTVYAYTKDEKADIKGIQESLGTPHVAILPNVGREAGTYFSHILEHWDDLARHTLFIQAEAHELEHAKNRIEDYFVPATGVLSLGMIEQCDCTNCQDSWDPSRTFPRIEELYSALNGEFCPQKIALTYLGQMIASASRIRGRGQSTYRYLKSVLESDMDHFIHNDERQGMFGDEESNPYFGHTVERSYMVLWDCADEKIVERCGGWGGLMSRREEGMEDGHCQCLDKERG